MLPAVDEQVSHMEIPSEWVTRGNSDLLAVEDDWGDEMDERVPLPNEWTDVGELAPFQQSVREKVSRKLATLTDEEQRIVYCLFWEDMSVTAAAKHLGMHRSTLYERQKRIYGVLGEQLKDAFLASLKPAGPAPFSAATKGADATPQPNDEPTSGLPTIVLTTGDRIVGTPEQLAAVYRQMVRRDG